MLALTDPAGRLLSRSIREARRLATKGRRARSRSARLKVAAIEQLEQMADRAERVSEQIKLRVAGKPIPDRLVSIFDPDARPIRKGKLGKPNEFGYVAQICEVTQNTRPGCARVHPPRGQRDRQPAGEHAAALPDRRARAARAEAARGRARRRLREGPDRRDARRPRTRAGVHRRARATRLETHPTAPSQVPNRRRGPHQPPQARLRDASLKAQGRGRNASLERLGDPRLQP